MSDKKRSTRGLKVLCLLLELCIAGFDAYMFTHIDGFFDAFYDLLEPYGAGSASLTPASAAISVVSMVALALAIKTLIESIVSTASIDLRTEEHMASLVCALVSGALIVPAYAVMCVMFMSVPVGAAAAAIVLALLYFVIPDGRAMSFVPAFRHDEKASLVVDGVVAGERYVEVASEDELQEVLDGIAMVNESAGMGA